jgi:hypothetical protein
MSKVRWGGNEMIDWEEAKRLASEAEELAKGFNLSTTETRSWYEDTYTVSTTDYFELARFIQKIRGDKNDSSV